MKSPYLWAQTDDREWGLWKEAQQYPRLAHSIRDCGKVSGLPHQMHWSLQFSQAHLEMTSKNKGEDAFLALFTSKNSLNVPDFQKGNQFLDAMHRTLVKGDTVFIPQETSLFVWGIPEGSQQNDSTFATIDAFAEERHFKKSQGRDAGFYSVIATCSDLAQALAFPVQLWGLFLNFPEASSFLEGAQEAAAFLGASQVHATTLKVSSVLPAGVIWIAYGCSLFPKESLVNAPLSAGMSLYLAGSIGGACHNHYEPHRQYWKEQFSPSFRKLLYQKLNRNDKIKDISDGLEATCKSWLFENPQVNLSIHQKSLERCISPLFPQTTFSEMWFGGDDYSLMIASFQNFSDWDKIICIGAVTLGSGQVLLS
ncbi:MAG: hypothetical protein AABZ60_16700 [Planctomycetota bacterium]